MKKMSIILSALALSVANAQTINQTQIRHVETSLNHLTVLEFGEQVTTLAVADPDSFKVEHHDDKVFVMPLREKVSTNLFVWTTSRQISYELDPAGQLATMDVLIRNAPPPDLHAASTTATAIADDEMHKIASLVLTQTIMGAQNIAREPVKPDTRQVEVVLEAVYHAKERLYIRYSLMNGTDAPFRLTPPDALSLIPTQTPVSLLALRNHQLSAQTVGALKAKSGSSLTVTQFEAVAHDLAPGQKTTGVVSVGCPQDNAPQLYQFDFGVEHGNPLRVQAVL